MSQICGRSLKPRDKRKKSPSSQPTFSATEWVEGQKRREESAPEVAALRRENQNLKRRLRERMGGEDIIIRAVQHVLSEHPPELAIPPRPAKSKQKEVEWALLHLTDWQGGKLTESYSVAALDRRMRRLANEVESIITTRRSGAKIDRLNILLGGDMVEGELIFPHQAHEIEMGVFEQALRAVPDIAGRLILDLTGMFDRVDVYCVTGNHGRPAPKSSPSHPKTNWDRAFYEYLRTCLLGPPWRPRKELNGRLSMHVSDTFYSVSNIWEWGCLLVHGDEIKGGFAGYPWYGAGRRTMGWIDAIPEPWEYLYFGHYHQYVSAVINHRTFFCTASPESGNVFAQQNLAAVGHPAQRFQFFSRPKGLIADYPLYLEEPGDRLPQRLRPTKWLAPTE